MSRGGDGGRGVAAHTWGSGSSAWAAAQACGSSRQPAGAAETIRAPACLCMADAVGSLQDVPSGRHARHTRTNKTRVGALGWCWQASVENLTKRQGARAR